MKTDWPDPGDRIYYLDETGRVRAGTWGKGSGHRDRDAFIGVYRTRTEAEAAAAKIKRIMDHLRTGKHIQLMARGDLMSEIEEVILL